MNRTPLDSVEEELKKFVDESDRGCVLLLAARLDAFLNELHQRYIIAKASPPKQTLNELFSPWAPLGSFAGKIRLGYAYGIISREDFLDLERIRELRNDAAHSDQLFSFNDPEVKGCIRQIGTPERVCKVLPRETQGEDFERKLMEPLTDDPKLTRFYLLLSSIYLHNTMLQRLNDMIEANG